MKHTSLNVIALLALGLTTASLWAAGDPAAGESKAATCAGCHGAAGEGMGDNPAIAGIPAADHLAMLKEYKAGKRGEPMMQMLAGQLSEADMADIAAYYAKLKK